MAQSHGAIQKSLKPPPQPAKSWTYEFERSLLTDVLRVAENDTSLEVTNVQFSTGSNAGDNYMSTIQRALLQGTKNHGDYFQKYLIMKRQMADLERRRLFMADLVWANEEHIYKVILPTLGKHSKRELPHPRLYYSDQELFILEDLNDSGYTMGDRLNGLDLDQTLLVMENISRFHASSLAMQCNDPIAYKNIKDNLKHPYTSPENKMDAYVQKSLLNAVEVLKASKTPQKYNLAIECLEKVIKNPEKYLPVLTAAPKNDLAVIIHGDLWVNNLLFSYNESHRPVGVKFVDYQGTRIGSTAMDIHHFLYTSVDPKVRRKYFDSILNFYYDSLVRNLKSNVTSKNDEFLDKITFETISKEFWEYRMYGFLNAVLALPTITCEPVNENNLQKNNSVLGDTTTERFRERLTDVVEEFMQRDWISLEFSNQ